MACRSLQPLWEGLVDRHWRDGDLVGFQEQLAGLNLLANHTNTLNRVALAQIEVWRQRRAPAATPPGVRPRPLGLSRDFFLPRGWWSEQSILLYEDVRKRIARINAATGQITMDAPEDWNEFSGLELDSDASAALQPQLYWWGGTPGCLSYSQTVVNQGILACALERFRVSRGAYPENAAELIPEFLDTLPNDLERGRPLLYDRVKDARYILRGVGPDHQDDRVSKGSDDWLWQYPTNSPAQAAR